MTTLVKGTTFTTGGTAATSYTVDLPDVGIASLAVVSIFKRLSGTMTWPSGWTQLAAANNGDSTARMEIRARVLDGTDGPSIVVTAPVAAKAVGWAWGYVDWHGTTMPEATIVAGSGNVTPDPPSLTPSWGATAGTIYVAVNGRNQNQTTTVYPTGFTDNQEDAIAGGSSPVTGSICSQVSGSSPVNPAAFTVTGTSVAWTAATVAVRPLVAAPPSTLRNTNDHCADALIALYGGPESNVGAMIQRYRAENSFTAWDTWVAHLLTTTGKASYADAANAFWDAL